MYDNMRDVEFRLRGTLVEYKGQLRYVSDVYELESGEYALELVGVRMRVKLGSKLLKITNIKTGYMSIAGHLVYLSRKPTRAYRQGLRHDNCDCYGDLTFQDVAHFVRGDMRLDDELLDNCKILSRDYAVRNGKLYYRTRLVGIYYEGKPYLNNDKKFLSESLGETYA